MIDLTEHQVGERVILVSVIVQMLNDLDADEFSLLAKSAGAEILEHIHAQRIRPDAKLFIGSGKAEEIAQRVEELDANLVIFAEWHGSKHGLIPLIIIYSTKTAILKKRNISFHYSSVSYSCLQNQKL